MALPRPQRLASPAVTWVSRVYLWCDVCGASPLWDLPSTPQARLMVRKHHSPRHRDQSGAVQKWPGLEKQRKDRETDRDETLTTRED